MYGMEMAEWVAGAAGLEVRDGRRGSAYSGKYSGSRK